MTRHYLDLGSAPDWLKQTSQIPSGTTNQKHYTQYWMVTRHQYGISALVSQMSFRGETSGGVCFLRLASEPNWNQSSVLKKYETWTKLR